VFGRGSIEFIRTDNRKVITYVRRFGNDVLLCVANLSRNTQPVTIPLPQFAGLTPVETLGQTVFPRITDQPYFLTLSGYGFYWFQLQEVVVPATARTAPLPDEEPAAVPALFAGVVWDSIFDGSMRTIIERRALLPFLQRQRWFGGKARPLAYVRFVDWTTLRRGSHPAFLTIIEVEYRDGGRERYVLPLAMTSGDEATAIEQHYPAAILSRISGARKGLLYDGLFDNQTCATLLAAIRERREVPMTAGRILADNLGMTPALASTELTGNIARSSPDQSNTSAIFGWQLSMMLFRRIEPGVNPDVEVGRFLTTRRSTRVPPLVGMISYQREHEEPSSIAMLQEFVPNQGNGWEVAVEEVGRYLERVLTLPVPQVSHDEARAWIWSSQSTPPAAVVEAIQTYLTTAELIGRRTGELHVQLAATADDAAFTPEAYTPGDLRHAVEGMRRHAEEQLQLLDAAAERLDQRRRELASLVLARRDDLLHQFDDLMQIGSAGARIRCHGDYHLGQVLVKEGDIVIIDFEGEPARSIAERRAKCSPLRDVAGMLRSFSYAALTGLGAATKTRPEDVERLAPWTDLWEVWVGAVFLRAYLLATRGAGFLPSESGDVEMLLQGFIVDKALYELGYELNNRPEWVHIPLAGLLRLHTALHA
jgi:maltose alpha-D-glucosyltransferase/alpha-amylase